MCMCVCVCPFTEFTRRRCACACVCVCVCVCVSVCPFTALLLTLLVASAQDYENKWTYFGAVDGSYSIFPGTVGDMTDVCRRHDSHRT